MDGHHPSTAYRLGYFVGRCLQQSLVLLGRVAFAVLLEDGRGDTQGRPQGGVLEQRVRMGSDGGGVAAEPGPGPLRQVRSEVQVRAAAVRKVRVDGYRHGVAYMLRCTVCGPLGVAENYAVALSEVRLHLQAHGITHPEEIAT